METVELEFKNRLVEHVAAARLYYKTTLWWKADKFVSVLLVAFGVYLLATVGGRWWTLIWFPLAVAEWFNLFSPQPLQVFIFFRRNPKFLETYRLAFSDEGIHFKTQSIDSRLAWTHYRRMIENDRLFLLVYGRSMYTVLPKRAFSDDSQLAAFRSLVGRNLPKGGVVGE